MGVAGPQGERGYPGNKGERGLHGVKGDKGERVSSMNSAIKHFAFVHEMDGRFANIWFNFIS